MTHRRIARVVEVFPGTYRTECSCSWVSMCVTHIVKRKAQTALTSLFRAHVRQATPKPTPAQMALLRQLAADPNCFWRVRTYLTLSACRRNGWIVFAEATYVSKGETHTWGSIALTDAGRAWVA